MTVYETLQLFFMAMVLGTVTGLVFAMWLYWMKN